jgi:hypothetical protein
MSFLVRNSIFVAIALQILISLPTTWKWLTTCFRLQSLVEQCVAATATETPYLSAIKDHFRVTTTSTVPVFTNGITTTGTVVATITETPCLSAVIDYFRVTVTTYVVGTPVAPLPTRISRYAHSLIATNDSLIPSWVSKIHPFTAMGDSLSFLCLCLVLLMSWTIARSHYLSNMIRAFWETQEEDYDYPQNTYGIARPSAAERKKSRLENAMRRNEGMEHLGRSGRGERVVHRRSA